MKQHVYGQVFLDTDDNKYYLYLGDNNYEVITQQAVIDGALNALAELESTVANKQDAEDGKGLSTNDFTDSDKSLVNQIQPNNNSSVNRDENLQNQINDTNNLVNGLAGGIDSKVDKILGKGLSTNDYTDEDRESVNDTSIGLSAEITNRSNGDIFLQNQIDQLNQSLGGIISGYRGIALPSTVLTQDGYYLAGASGVYTNAGNLNIDLTQGIYLISKTGNVYTPVLIPISFTNYITQAQLTAALISVGVISVNTIGATDVLNTYTDNGTGGAFTRGNVIVPTDANAGTVTKITVYCTTAGTIKFAVYGVPASDNSRAKKSEFTATLVLGQNTLTAGANFTAFDLLSNERLCFYSDVNNGGARIGRKARSSGERNYNGDPAIGVPVVFSAANFEYGYTIELTQQKIPQLTSRVSTLETNALTPSKLKTELTNYGYFSIVTASVPDALSTYTSQPGGGVYTRAVPATAFTQNNNGTVNKISYWGVLAGIITFQRLTKNLDGTYTPTNTIINANVSLGLNTLIAGTNFTAFDVNTDDLIAFIYDANSDTAYGKIGRKTKTAGVLEYNGLPVVGTPLSFVSGGQEYGISFEILHNNLTPVPSKISTLEANYNLDHPELKLASYNSPDNYLLTIRDFFRTGGKGAAGEAVIMYMPDYDNQVIYDAVTDKHYIIWMLGGTYFYNAAISEYDLNTRKVTKTFFFDLDQRSFSSGRDYHCHATGIQFNDGHIMISCESIHNGVQIVFKTTVARDIMSFVQVQQVSSTLSDSGAYPMMYKNPDDSRTAIIVRQGRDPITNNVSFSNVGIILSTDKTSFTSKYYICSKTPVNTGVNGEQRFYKLKPQQDKNGIWHMLVFLRIRDDDPVVTDGYKYTRVYYMKSADYGRTWSNMSNSFSKIVDPVLSGSPITEAELEANFLVTSLDNSTKNTLDTRCAAMVPGGTNIYMVVGVLKFGNYGSRIFSYNNGWISYQLNIPNVTSYLNLNAISDTTVDIYAHQTINGQMEIVRYRSTDRGQTWMFGEQLTSNSYGTYRTYFRFTNDITAAKRIGAVGFYPQLGTPAWSDLLIKEIKN